MRTLAETADEMLAAAEKLTGEGAHETAAEVAIAAGKLWRSIAKSEAINRLTAGKYSPTLPKAMDVEHREAISDGRAGRKARALLSAAREAGLPGTMKELAEKLGVKPSFLSQAVSGKKKMPTALAERIRALTGWEP